MSTLLERRLTHEQQNDNARGLDDRVGLKPTIAVGHSSSTDGAQQCLHAIRKPGPGLGLRQKLADYQLILPANAEPRCGFGRVQPVKEHM
jgi:hypothetical protein